MADNLKSLTVREFLSNDSYVIPIYQRNYDWGDKEVLQLIEDVADYAKENPKKNYYIGSAVVYSKSANGNAYFELIDGQQRLTTLTILTTLIFNEKDSFGISPNDIWYKHPNISFDYRKDSDAALDMLRKNDLGNRETSNIIEVYKIFKKNLKKIISDKQLELEKFADYLFKKVIIVRISVPEDTDLNHYFEIMNTRGEQLEKHEVLKAKLMSHLDESEHILFNAIWEACSDMTSYVQMNFTIKNRRMLFDDKEWNKLKNDDFDEINKKDKKEVSDNNIEKSIAELLVDAKSNGKYNLPNSENKKEEQDRFESIINFPNFLLHVLKIMYRFWDGYDEATHEEIKLDDKRLLQIFDNVIDSKSVKENRQSFIKKFIVELLKIRLLFDRYVIKREYDKKYSDDKERWSLKGLKRYHGKKVNYVNTFSDDDASDESDINKDIRMLEAMFHVSAPTQIYKHWLNAVLYYVYNQKTVESEKMRNALYQLATTYMSDIYLNDNAIDFETIIYKNENDFESQNKVLCWDNINKGCDVANFIFNFYDYIVWKENSNKYPKFEFSYRTSVEHFYPQNPMSGYKKLDEESLNNFGNLCLISRTMNSKFGNNMPKAKLENFGNIEEVRNGLSIKLLEMMSRISGSNADKWQEKEIKEFGEECKERIKNSLKS